MLWQQIKVALMSSSQCHKAAFAFAQHCLLLIELQRNAYTFYSKLLYNSFERKTSLAQHLLVEEVLMV